MIYKLIYISNTKEIQQEILKSLLDKFDNLDNIPKGFSAADTSQLKKDCPALNKFLESKQLFSRWVGTGMSFLKDSSLSIHSDSLIKNRIYALNIPIINCDNSYTIWYRLKDNIIPRLDFYKSGKESVLSYQYKDSDTEEICRLEINQPTVVNVKQPHRGISFSGKPRILISLRFREELTEEEVNQL
jgi:hypothetical protein